MTEFTSPYLVFVLKLHVCRVRCKSQIIPGFWSDRCYFVHSLLQHSFNWSHLQKQRRFWPPMTTTNLLSMMATPSLLLRSAALVRFGSYCLSACHFFIASFNDEYVCLQYDNRSTRYAVPSPSKPWTTCLWTCTRVRSSRFWVITVCIALY